MDAMRECMWSVFDAPLAALAPDPRLSGERLINHRLSTARQAHVQNSSRYTLIPAGVSAGPEPISYITIDSKARLLSSRYYAARIRSAEPVLPVLDGGGVDRVGDLTGIVAHTCNLTAGGLLAGESRGLPPLNCYGSVR